jgi:CIC family chloride channel protein
MTTATLAPSKQATLNLEWFAVAGWASLLGLMSGLACVAVRLFFRLLQFAFLKHGGSLPSAAMSISPTYRLVIPIVGAAIATILTWYYSRRAKGEVFEDYVEAVRLRGGHIPLRPAIWRTLSSAFSIATGAAVGKEGSMIQFSAAIGSWIGARAPMKGISLSRKVAFAAAAAVAAAYQAPLAGVFFAIEIVLGEWKLKDLAFLFLASFSGWLVSRSIEGGGPMFPVTSMLSLTPICLWLLALAILAGIVGPAYQKMLTYTTKAKRLPLALLWGAALVGGLSLFEPRVWGNGDVALTNTLAGALSLSAVAAVLLFRMLATSASMGTGTVGGVFTPTLFAGAAGGYALAQLLHFHEPVLFAVGGMAFLMAGVTHAPFMASMMATELTGQWHLLPMLLLCSLLASAVARRISDVSLYGIASGEPADNRLLPSHERKEYRL